jgi:CheY-like chemotaxis protein
MRPVLLIADNNPDYLTKTTLEFEAAGYHVLTASNPQQARNILEQEQVDLAILDVRLADDDSETDRSGLEIARDRSFLKIPKIMLTNYGAHADSRAKVLGLAPEKLPYALDFVEKAKGREVLIQAVRRALRLWPGVRTSAIEVSQQTKLDYAIILGQARRNYYLALGVSIIGFIFISLGIALAFFSSLAIGVVASASGIIIQGLSYLFFKRLDLSNVRMDSYHRELLETYWLELLLAASERLPLDRRVACNEQSILAATRRWLGPQSGPSGDAQPPVKPITLKQSEERRDGKDYSVDG